jgi:peptidoglycan/xylan/chitin deacetylase (PgdA/CDA1 family)
VTVGPKTEGRSNHARIGLRQTIIGLLLLPLSLAPFIAYFKFTSEGALLWAKVRTTLWTPELRPLTESDAAWISEHRPSFNDAVALLVWHGIGARGDGDGGFSISPERFAEQLTALKAAGMNTVTARDVALAFAGKRELPPNAVMISFDDGRADAMLYADPLLDQADMQATMFVITDAAASSGIYYAKWDELRDYVATGRWDLQSHSAESHHEQTVGDGASMPVLTSLAPGETLEEFELRINRDLKEASDALESNIGVEPSAFAYPFGAYGGRYDSERTNDARIEAVLKLAVAANYDIAFEQDDQGSWGLATCADDPYRLRRLEVGDWSGRNLVERIANAADSLDEARVSCMEPFDAHELTTAPDAQ